MVKTRHTNAEQDVFLLFILSNLLHMVIYT